MMMMNGPRLKLKGAHGIWELAINRAHHADISQMVRHPSTIAQSETHQKRILNTPTPSQAKRSSNTPTPSQAKRSSNTPIHSRACGNPSQAKFKQKRNPISNEAKCNH
jgi:hypothetical protein